MRNTARNPDPITHKVHIYLQNHSVCPLVRIGTSPPPLPQASVSLPPEPKGGGVSSIFINKILKSKQNLEIKVNHRFKVISSLYYKVETFAILSLYKLFLRYLKSLSSPENAVMQQCIIASSQVATWGWGWGEGVGAGVSVAASFHALSGVN